MIEIREVERGLHRLEAEQWLPRPLEEVFDFFSRPENLERLTPPLLRFEIMTPDIAMCEGALIDYRLKVHGLPLRWRSEIRDWEPPHRFIDFQLRGPYKLWNHLHTFEEKDGGTLIGDVVDYRVPLGGWVNRIFVEKDVRKIFGFRQQVLRGLFGNPASCSPRSGDGGARLLPAP